MSFVLSREWNPQTPPVGQRLYTLAFDHHLDHAAIIRRPIFPLFLPPAPPVGPQQESSKKEVLRVCSQMDEMMEEAKEEAANGNQGPSRRR